VTNAESNSVSTIDVASRTKNRRDITVGKSPVGVAITPDGKTAFVTNGESNSVSTIDVASRTKNRRDITVGSDPFAIPPGRDHAVFTMRIRDAPQAAWASRFRLVAEPHRTLPARRTSAARASRLVVRAAVRFVR
jgi:YVTN family beta-propeller protein